MIFAFYGQPCSGKSTISRAISNLFYAKGMVVSIDGDDLRNIFKNNNYSKEGRMENLKRASDIAAFLDAKGFIVLMSVMYPYGESRSYLTSLAPHTKWVYLHYDSAKEVRGRESYHMADFESPSIKELKEGNTLVIDTSQGSVTDVVDIIKKAFL